jgi:hypothetical protein
MDIAHLPIYWRSATQHHKVFEKKRARAVEKARAWGPEYAEKVARRDPDGWYPWMYNDVVGWIKLSVDRGLFEFGIYLKKEAGRRSRSRSADITVYDASATKVYGSQYESSAEIAKAVAEALDGLCEEVPLKGCTIPRDDFQRWSRFVDWLAVRDA